MEGVMECLLNFLQLLTIFLTEDYPFVRSTFKGQIDPSFQHRVERTGMRNGPHPGCKREKPGPNSRKPRPVLPNR
ncbi:MAG TPA: hypothetical protein DCR17_09265 [Verrucomicrobiales bacterium]|nr:hypothetical protein [Pedosphaera sp.]HAO66858.1 hypothetical protein [Verrucomicrobiales bacterium]HAR00496.1 hypothetical protein [Verrucomicrobiales bacterium]HAW02793.1 hypothetical protein [Verrucomicrobiales bacterium]HBP57279.1 hypothetical protein [Verrucomicrobiales bacterium]